MHLELIAKLVVIFLSFGGFLISFYIWQKKARQEKLVCPVGASCDTVVHSKYSKFFGVPLEYMGMGYYLGLAIIYALLILLAGNISPEVAFIVLGISAMAVFFSAYLIFIQAFVLKNWCTWCIGSALISTGILVFSFLGIDIDLSAFFAQYKGLIVVLHAAAAAIGVGAATITDVFFFKFLKDYRISEFESDVMKTLSQVVWAALALLILTGIGLFIPEPAILLGKSKFIVKVIIVAGLVINGIILNLVVSPRLITISFGKRHVHQPGELHRLRKFAFGSGAFSIVSWYMVFILGSLRDVPMSIGQLFGIYLGALAGAIIISQIMDRMHTREKL